MRRGLVMVFLLVAVAMAGCTGDDEVSPQQGDDDPGNPDSGGAGGSEGDAQEPAAPGEAPAEWAVGHYWSYTLSHGGEFTLVVTEDQGTEWFLDTPDEETAWFNVLEEISFLGQIRKSDLAGSQGDDRVRYFDFPLEAEKEWTTDWDGVERRVVTTQVGETFQFEAYESDVRVVSYEYDPSVGWLSGVVFYDNQTGEEDFSMELEDHQTDWQGTVTRWDAENHVDVHQEAGLFGAFADVFSVQEGVEELWFRVWFRCDPEPTFGRVLLLASPLSPESEHLVSVFECMEAEDVYVHPGPEAGDWQLWGQIQSTELEGTSLETEIWSRSQVELSIEPAA